MSEIKKNSELPASKYQLGARAMPIVYYKKDMYVIIQDNLHFKFHIDAPDAEAHARSVLIHKCFVSKDPKPRLNAYVMFRAGVRRILLVVMISHQFSEAAIGSTSPHETTSWYDGAQLR